MNWKVIRFAWFIIAPMPAFAESQTTVSWHSGPLERKIKTVIELQLEPGWHTYWENPGVGGMPLELKIDLPQGWAAGLIQYPVPKRFMTGELPGFGYEEKVLLPVNLIPPFGYEGEIPELKASLRWLQCTDEACVPGKADIVLRRSKNPDLIAQAYKPLPVLLNEAKMKVEEAGENLQLTVSLPKDSDLDLTKFEIFPSPGMFSILRKTLNLRSPQASNRHGPLKLRKASITTQKASR